MSLELLNSKQYSEIINRCERFYGIEPTIWQSFELIKTNSALWLINKKMALDLESLQFDTAGLRIFSGDKAPYKPTFAFFSFFNKNITKGFFELDDNKANAFIHRNNIDFDCEIKGYYGVKNKGFFIGVGLGKGSTLLSQVPKKIGNQVTRT